MFESSCLDMVKTNLSFVFPYLEVLEPLVRCNLDGKMSTKDRLRLRRYISNKGSMELFSLLNKHQLKDSKKMKFCDHIVVNNKSLSILKRKLLNIIKLYE